MNPTYSAPLLRQGRPTSFSQNFLSSALTGMVTILLAGGVATAFAQTPAQVIDEGLRRQEERVRDQQQQVEPKVDVLKPQAASQISTTLPKETPCFVI